MQKEVKTGRNGQKSNFHNAHSEIQIIYLNVTQFVIFTEDGNPKIIFPGG